MIKIYFFIVLIFVYYLICNFVYIIYSKINENRLLKNKEKLKSKSYEYIEKYLKQFEEDGILALEDKKFLKKLVNKEAHKENIMEYLNKNKEKRKVYEFVEESEIFVDTILNLKKTEHDLAIKAMIISDFKIKNFNDDLVEGCSNSSVYVQVTSLEALALIGDLQDFLYGLKNVLSSEETLINSKIIVNKIMKFSGERTELNDELLGFLESKADERLKLIVLKYFSYEEYEKTEEVVYRLIQNPIIEKEVKIASLKHIIRKKSNKVKNVLIYMLNSTEWEIRAICVSTLGQYESDNNIIQILKLYIKDTNWYVRRNSAMSLFKLTENKNSLTNIIYGKDLYASDAMLSILSDEGLLEKILFESVA